VTTPKICGVIIDRESADLAGADTSSDMFEVRIDMIGGGWREIAASLHKPWIACCRSKNEGGKWSGSEPERFELLLEASGMGAAIVDIELSAENLSDKIDGIKQNSRCLLSFHDFKGTPLLEDMEKTIRKQLDFGADICKVVTTANSIQDNQAVLKLIKQFPGREVVAFAMGDQGYLSRVLCPLAGGSFTYASLSAGKESAPGQITSAVLRRIYDMLERP